MTALRLTRSLVRPGLLGAVLSCALLCSCSSLWAPKERPMVGDYHAVRGGSALGFNLRLQADGTYREYAYRVIEPKVKAPGLTSTPVYEIVDVGTWRYSGGVLVLRSGNADGDERRFTVLFDPATTKLSVSGQTAVSYSTD